MTYAFKVADECGLKCALEKIGPQKFKSLLIVFFSPRKLIFRQMA